MYCTAYILQTVCVITALPQPSKKRPIIEKIQGWVLMTFQL